MHITKCRMTQHEVYSIRIDDTSLYHVDARTSSLILRVLERKGFDITKEIEQEVDKLTGDFIFTQYDETKQ